MHRKPEAKILPLEIEIERTLRYKESENDINISHGEAK